MAAALPVGPRYAAVRAPIAEGGGFAWFANRGLGRPVAESLRATMDWFRRWLDTIAPPGRPVILVGFSGGAAFAGGLVLDDPARFTGAAILYGTLPFDAGVPTTPARLTGVPVFLAHGAQDTVIPRELLDRTWSYLLGDAGAPTVARNDPVGHEISTTALTALGGWLQERLAFRAHRGAPSPGPTSWPGLPRGGLPDRAGPRPAVSPGIPQEQQQRQRSYRAAGATLRPAHRATRSDQRAVHDLSAGCPRTDAPPTQARTRRRLPGTRRGRVRPPAPRLRRLATPRAAPRARSRRHHPGLGRSAPTRRGPTHPGHGADLRAAHAGRT